MTKSALAKRHRYLTVVLDLKTGAVVFVGDGKGADALDPFWKQLKRAKSKIDAVAIDMSPAYISAIIKKTIQDARQMSSKTSRNVISKSAFPVQS